MEVLLGLDMGGSATKIVAFQGETLLAMERGSLSNCPERLRGEVQRLLLRVGRNLDEVSSIILTGVGAARFGDTLWGRPTAKVYEFEATGRGGLALSGLSRATVISAGTGTALVRATEEACTHIGGSGIGGGTLLGLSTQLLHVDDMDDLLALSADGDLSSVDLQIKDICAGEIATLPPDSTAAHFGKRDGIPCAADLALGLIHMVLETIAVLGALSCSGEMEKYCVVVGALATIPQAQQIFDRVGALHGIPFLIPKMAAFATAIGAVRIYNAGKTR